MTRLSFVVTLTHALGVHTWRYASRDVALARVASIFTNYVDAIIAESQEYDRPTAIKTTTFAMETKEAVKSW